MLSKELLDELKIIIKEEFNTVMSEKNLSNFANSLVGYFDLLAKHEFKKIYGKS